MDRFVAGNSRCKNEMYVCMYLCMGFRQSPSATAVRVGLSGAHTSVGVAVGAPASTWPHCRRSLSTAISSCLEHRNPAIRQRALPFNGSSLSICYLRCIYVRMYVCMHACMYVCMSMYYTPDLYREVAVDIIALY